MRLTRQMYFYLATLICVGAAIAAALLLGPPRLAAAVHHPDAVAGLLAGLRMNLCSPLSRLLVQWLTIIVASRLMVCAVKRLAMPAVIGEMVAGILLGPSLLGLIAPGAFALLFPAGSLGALRIVSEVGICLFMFTVGLQLSITQLRSRARSAMAVSHTSIIVPFLLGIALAYPLFAGLAGARATFTSFALFLGIAISITAFPVLARILRDRNLAHTDLGKTAIACAAIEDVTAWSIMAFVVSIAGSRGIGGAALSLLLVILFIVTMGVGVRRALPRWLGADGLATQEPSAGAFALAMCMLIAAALCAEVLGIHALFGAFLAGAIMPDSESFRQRIGAHLEKLSSTMLLPLYFALTGLRTQISLLDGLHDWMLCLLIIAVAILGKLGAGTAAARLSGMTWSESLQLGALMNTRGLVELIALNIGYDMGILSPRIFTMLVVMALVTTFMSGPMLTWFARRSVSISQRREPSPA